MSRPPRDIASDRLGGRQDDVYSALIAAHEGLNFEESAGFNARLVLMLANAVGDFDTVVAAIEAARQAGRTRPEEP